MAAKPLRITLADGSTVDVQPTLEDRLKFEQTLRKNKGWGKLEDNALKLIPFQAWSAAHRQGLTALTWEQFTTGQTAALDVAPLDDSDDDPDDDLEVEGLGEGTPAEASTSYPSLSAFDSE